MLTKSHRIAPTLHRLILSVLTLALLALVMGCGTDDGEGSKGENNATVTNKNGGGSNGNAAGETICCVPFNGPCTVDSDCCGNDYPDNTWTCSAEGTCSLL